MAIHKRSLRNLINYILVVMGIFALMLVWLTITRHQQIVVSEQRKATEVLADHVVSHQLATHEAYLVDLGMTMQAEKKFRAAFNAKASTQLHNLITDQFHQYFTTTGLVDLKRITVYDVDFNVVTRASSQELQQEQSTICPTLHAVAQSREGSARNKPFTGLCRQQGMPYHIAIVPIGGLRVTGYTAVIANLANTIEQIHDLPGMPFSITLPSDETIFKTAEWPESHNSSHTIIATHTIDSNDGKALLTLNVANDVTQMNERLSELMQRIFVLALFVTGLFIYLTRQIFHQRIVIPLMRLNQHMERVQVNHEELGKDVALSGCKELDELSSGFNSMARKLVEAQQELHNKAHTDALTGLPNREALYCRLEQLEQLSKRSGKNFTLLMMDLNKFKQVNDTMGHHAGDELIRQVGHRLGSCLRASDTVARLGGDEFAALLPTTGRREDAIEVCNKLVAECSRPFSIEGKEVVIGTSIGIAIYPDTAEDTDHLMRCADKAMYQAKQSQECYSMCKTHCGKHDTCHKDFGRPLVNNDLTKPEITAE